MPSKYHDTVHWQTGLAANHWRSRSDRHSVGGFGGELAISTQQRGAVPEKLELAGKLRRQQRKPATTVAALCPAERIGGKRSLSTKPQKNQFRT